MPARLATRRELVGDGWYNDRPIQTRQLWKRRELIGNGPDAYVLSS
jgi:hypothetical protein